MPELLPSAYGSDVLCHRGGGVWDLDPTFKVESGIVVLVEHLARALQTAAGSMIDEPLRGVDLEELESARTAAGFARTLQARIEAELRLDERVDTLDVQVRINGDAWTIDVRGTGALGPFDEVFSLNSGTLEILTTGGGTSAG